MSRAAGRALLPRPRHDDPVRASTAGVGQLLLAARDAGARRMVIGCGGSSTTDGGLGAYEAVGSPAALRGIELVVACDVTTRFGDAAAVFGPQKGATAAQVVELGQRLVEVAARYHRETGIDVTAVPGGGAAGGLAGGLVALGARIEPGFDLVAGLVGLAGRLERADLAVTGEGHLDPPSFHGKVPGGVLDLARARGAHGAALPVLCIAGGAEASVLAAPPPGLDVVSLTARFGRARARAETTRLVGLVTADALVPVLPLNEPIGHTAGAPRRLSPRPPGPPSGRPAWRSDQHREASPWDCSKGRWPLSPAQDEASDAKRHSCSRARAPGSSSTTSAPGCTARARRTRIRQRKSSH